MKRREILIEVGGEPIQLKMACIDEASSRHARLFVERASGFRCQAADLTVRARVSGHKEDGNTMWLASR